MIRTGLKQLTQRAARTASFRAAARFGREEDGSLIVFGLFCFVMMLLMTGVALDVMRYEERRTVLQATIDRAALAAADLQQTLPPKDVVKDYFVKAGLTPPKDEDIVVEQGAYNEYRKVSVKTSENLPTWFMRMVGINEMTTPAASTAEESIGQVEISLILDISGSMGRNNRLTNLKPAAKNFVDKIFDSTEPGKVSISIVPYSTQVNLTDDFASYFNISGEHGYSNCIEFDKAKGDFDTTAMDVGFGAGARVYQRNGHFDPFVYSKYDMRPSLLNCRTEAGAKILPFSGDRDQLKSFIDSLSAGGNTSIDIGMKWGAALLDPSLQPVVDGMIADGKLPAAFGDRPYAFDDAEALKIIVLMTDGENTAEFRLNPEYSSGDSPLYTNTHYLSNDPWNIDQFSFYDPTRSGSNKYYSFKRDKWLPKPYGDNSGDKGDAVRMTWPEVWDKMSLRYFGEKIVDRALGWRERQNFFRNVAYDIRGENWYRNYSYPTAASDKDDRTTRLCNAAKAQNVKIFTIAFEAPTGGQNLLRSCASADGGFYNVAGLDIEKAFAGIVNSINKLRLTH